MPTPSLDGSAADGSKDPSGDVAIDASLPGSGPSTSAPVDAGDAGEPETPSEPCELGLLNDGTYELPYEGTAFGYVVHVPPTYDGTARMPLVLNWHGLTSFAEQQADFSGMNPVADEHGFIVVYPNSPTNSWNAGTCCGFEPERDDVGFARALVADVSSRACIDPRRVYSTGMSNGGFMSHRLACEAADLFAAVAPVAGKVGIPDCAPSRAVPVLHFHGTADALVSYDTALLSGEDLNVPETLQRWAERDHCDPESAVSYERGPVTCETWTACTDDVEVTLCTIAGDGHCWPGNSFCPFGASTMDIDASRAIAEFFARFVLPAR